MLRHLAGVAEIVEDVPLALAFYRDTLGLEVKERMGDDYAVLVVPGVLHFGVWSRAAAAESVFGDRGAVERIPLGFMVEFEAEDIERAAERVTSSACSMIQPPHEEPWKQVTCRAIAPGGGLLGLAITPWARRLVQPPQVGDDVGGQVN